jgi:2-amino-4-hydroxy-6-hydroxymethyldihydropteridine diphosphokinase
VSRCRRSSPFRMKHVATIGIGSNVGEKSLQCEKAISEILKLDRHSLLAASSLYRTKPVGYMNQDWFVNGVIQIGTDLDPFELHQALQSIERQLERKKTFRWGPRTIDLDILFFDEAEIRTKDLQIPHPRLHERQFVLVPLVEIRRDLIHPVLKKTVVELLEDLKEDQGVERLS